MVCVIGFVRIYGKLVWGFGQISRYFYSASRKYYILPYKKIFTLIGNNSDPFAHLEIANFVALL